MDDTRYDDLTPEELADEIAGLDKEIAGYQAFLAKMRKGLRQKEDLRDTLLEIYSKSATVRGWAR